MKEADITPEIIKLSKDIAEHWRMEIYEGCWFWCLDGGEQPFLRGDTTHVCEEEHDIIPIPSISDCEQKLKELGFVSLQILVNSEIKPTCVIWGRKTDTYEQLSKAKTSHLALLSALLEVLKI